MERFHFSSLGEDDDSVGDEKEVEDEEDVRLEVSSAPEDVTSLRGLERYSGGARRCPSLDRSQK